MPKVVDAFIFFNEFDLLELRLHELDPIVDKFVIMEASETFSGNPKPLMFLDRFDRYKNFETKICYHNAVTLEPPYRTWEDGWKREYYQRRVLGKAVLDETCDWRDNDILIVSDCDEIPRRATVEANLAAVQKQIYRLKQKSYYYNVNRLIDYGHDWASRARLGPLAILRESNGNVEAFRQHMRDDPNCPTIENGGWHFSYFGGSISNLRYKVSASAHSWEYYLQEDKQLVLDVLFGIDVHHRNSDLPQVFPYASETDPTLPEYLLANPDKFRHFTEAFFKEKYRGLL